MDPAAAIELEAMSQQKDLDEATAPGDSEVQRFYMNSVVFVTEGSGFLGKHLIEKLFRSCKISKLFLLMRPKKGKHIQERLTEILQDPVFNKLRKQKPDFGSKIITVEGDVAEIRLGIKVQDWNTLTEEVDVIFHAAATTRFDETLRQATLINVRGTREALNFGRACKKLSSFVHVSTAYTHATTNLIGHEIREEFHAVCVSPEAMISMAESMEADRLVRITNELTKGWPNSYTFTKSISEELIRSSSVGLPICIVRPGILVVLCAYKEPAPGWLDFSCMYGASGISLGTAMGVLHTIRVKYYIKLGLIPCDYVNNAIVVAARETASNQAKGGMDTRIYTVSSTKRNPVSWSEYFSTLDYILRGPDEYKKGLIEDTARANQEKLHTPLSIYYSYGYATQNSCLFMILSLFLHLIPAYVADIVCLFIGKKMRFAKLSKKVYNACNILSYFLINEWQFRDENLNRLFNNLSKQDKLIFNFDVTNINWPQYILIQCIGIRKYILKDGLKDTAYAMKKQRILGVLHYIFMTLYVYCIWKIVCLVFYTVISLINMYNI